jgi:hypothetical protein
LTPYYTKEGEAKFTHPHVTYIYNLIEHRHPHFRNRPRDGTKISPGHFFYCSIFWGMLQFKM